MKQQWFFAIVALLVGASPVFAQQASVAPSGATALCSDGTYYSGLSKFGACAHHHGVKTWLASHGQGAGNAGPASAPGAATPSTSAGGAMKPSAGAGQVWANETTHVYHCSTDKWYGKTHHGSYMSESDAVAKGFHPSHGHVCH
ncbi:DUF3761 domain-containing protein [Paraburkholderia sp. BR14263]|uniref:DUF3761 domain-containing protein n=1 Tax=unclassified Paraburkholderia TaxID=2615204 RepID=UPI0034CD9FF6